MRLAIYDFDGTLIDVNTLPLMYKRWKRIGINEQSRRPIWRRIIVRYMLHKLHLFGWDKRKFNPYTMEQTADLFRSVDRSVLDGFLQTNYMELLPHIPHKIKNQLKQDTENGYHTVLLSGNFDIILQPFQQLGFDTVIGTVSTKDKVLLSSKEVDVIIEQGKVDAITSTFPMANLSQSKAYADSNYDIPILELVGHPVAVNPDKQLLQYAKDNNWEILQTN